MEQGSYLLIEPGMAVRGIDGDLGTVAQVVADADLDIFRGIVISHGVLPTRKLFVSEDLVKSVVGHQVDVSLSKVDLASLPLASPTPPNGPF